MPELPDPLSLATSLLTNNYRKFICPITTAAIGTNSVAGEARSPNSSWREKRSGKFLDVGCGLGFFIDGIKQHSNWEVYGVEFSLRMPPTLRAIELGLNVRQGELVGR